MRHLIRHLLVPHHSNNHRAKALHIDMLLCYALVFAVCNFALRSIHIARPDILGYATNIYVNELLEKTNEQRAKLGLETLTINDELSEAAKQKAEDMFVNDYWAHNSPQGKTPWVFILGSGYQYTLAGENLAKNFSTSDGVVKAWMESPTHKANIVKDGYKDIGFAIVNGTLNGEETTLVVQMFGATDKPSVATSKKPVVVDTSAAIAGASSSVVPSTQINSIPTPMQTIVSRVNTLTEGISRTPIVHLPSATRDIVFVLIGIFILILAIDIIVVMKKNIIRVSGHNIAHILFFIALAIAITAISEGVLI